MYLGGSLANAADISDKFAENLGFALAIHEDLADLKHSATVAAGRPQNPYQRPVNNVPALV
jgi:hypothetical protein